MGTEREGRAGKGPTYAKDPVRRQPRLKQRPVQLEKVRAGKTEPWLLRRRKELGEPSRRSPPPERTAVEVTPD